MKAFLIALMLVAFSVGPSLHVCVGAQLAVVHATAAKLQEQDPPPPSGERRTPKDVVCARVARKGKAEACACHAHNCLADPSDPNNRSAHTDKACLNFCAVDKCACGNSDCP